MAGFAGVIDETIIPPAGVRLRQLAVIRSMSLNQTAQDSGTIKGIAKQEDEATAAEKDIGAAGLIAQLKN